jgi:hypothetical protein
LIHFKTQEFGALRLKTVNSFGTQTKQEHKERKESMRDIQSEPPILKYYVILAPPRMEIN